MAVHPLRPATDRRFGEPLPRQLPNQTQTPLQAKPKAPFFLSSCGVRNSFGISSRFRLLSPSRRQVVYALLTRSPLNSKKASFLLLPFDLHVLSTPPAFVLSQDQTLHDRLFVWLDFVLPFETISRFYSNLLRDISILHIGLKFRLIAQSSFLIVR